jgi:hypothetical protein
MKHYLIAFTFYLLLFPSHVSAVNYYVSPSGNDNNPGTQSSPFQTIPKAQSTVRGLIQEGLNSNIDVYLRDGTYTLTTPLTFTPDDSGTDQYSIKYRSYPSENPLISGGTSITGWTQHSGSIWVAHTGTDQFVRDLYRDGTRLIRARHPNNSGYAKITTVSSDRKSISYDQRRPNAGLGSDAEVITLHNWETSRTPIASSTNDSSFVTTTPIGFNKWYAVARVGSPIALENAYSLLDTPNEWYHNLAEHKVYYFAQAGENPNDHTFTAPILNNLINIQGLATRPINNLHISDLTFRFTNYVLPSTGYDGFQGNYRHLNKDGAWDARPLSMAITYKYTKNSSFTFNKINSLGAGGIALGVGVQDFSLNNNIISDVGGNCVHVGWDENLSMWDEWPTATINEGNVPHNIRLENNDILRCGFNFSGAYGILASHVADLSINHNNVHDLPYSGIGVTSKWGHGSTTQRHATITQNRIYSVMRLLSDGGAIYTLGDNPNSNISNNLIYEVHRNNATSLGAQNNGIFFDQGSGYYAVSQNIIYSTSGESVRYNGTDSSYMTFGTNYFNISPGQTGYPQTIASQAGIQPVTTPSPSINPSPQTKPGDTNGDAQVDGIDYVVWLNHYNQTLAGGSSIGDFNNSGKVDGIDYVVWVNNYGK